MFSRCLYRYKTIIPVILAGIMAASCVLDTVEPPVPPDQTNTVWIAVATAAADYSSANFELVPVEDYSGVIRNLIPGLHTDLALRSFGGEAYILERGGRDNVLKYGGQGVMYQQNLGTGLNVQDIAFASQTKAYISALEDPKLIVFDPQAGTVLSHIDLSRFNSFAGTDSAAAQPYVSALAVWDHYLYAACQRLNARFGLGDTSLIAVIDTRTDEIADSIKLTKKNPASLTILGGRMLVSSQGSWDDIGGVNAGVEIIDLATNTNLGVIVSGSALGGNPSDVIFVASDKAYTCVMDAEYITRLVPFDPQTGTVGAKVAGLGDVWGGLTFDGWKVYVGDRHAESSGVVVVDPITNAVERRIGTDMPPSALAVIVVE